jgi:hypothetical protein
VSPCLCTIVGVFVAYIPVLYLAIGPLRVPSTFTNEYGVEYKNGSGNVFGTFDVRSHDLPLYFPFPHQTFKMLVFVMFAGVLSFLATAYLFVVTLVEAFDRPKMPPCTLCVVYLAAAVSCVPSTVIAACFRSSSDPIEKPFHPTESRVGEHFLCESEFGAYTLAIDRRASHSCGDNAVLRSFLDKGYVIETLEFGNTSINKIVNWFPGKHNDDPFPLRYWWPPIAFLVIGMMIREVASFYYRKNRQNKQRLLNGQPNTRLDEESGFGLQTGASLL